MSGGCGILLIDKNEGFTSSDTVRMVARRLKVRKVGHTGTLDKFASGLLVCLAGPYTRLARYMVEQDKEYRALLEFGIQTETLDPEGEVVERAEVPSLSAIEAVLPDFRGTIRQRPPLYSAVHIDGTRAYKRARRGEEPSMPEREVSIETLEVLSWEAPFLSLRVSCSKGTYIRSLARDIALAAGSAAYVKELRRTRVGTADVAAALKADEVESSTPLLASRSDMERLLGLKGVTVPEDQVRSFLDGREPDPLRFEGAAGTEEHLFCFDTGDQFLGVLNSDDGAYRYGMVNGALRD